MKKKIFLILFSLILYSQTVFGELENKDDPCVRYKNNIYSDQNKKCNDLLNCKISQSKTKEEQKQARDAWELCKDNIKSNERSNKVEIQDNNFKAEVSGGLKKYCEEKLQEWRRTNGSFGDKKSLISYAGGACGKYWGEEFDEKKSGFNALINTLNKILEWIVGVSFMIAAVVAFIAGLMYISSSADPNKRSLAKNMLLKVFIGLFLIFSAWFIVAFILDVFAKGGSGSNTSGFSGLDGVGGELDQGRRGWYDNDI